MNRTQALCSAFGWQGGTIHQLALETGCETDDLLYGVSLQHERSNTGGWFAGRTCTLEFNLAINFPKHHGDLQFWLGVADGLMLRDKEQVTV